MDAEEVKRALRKSRIMRPMFSKSDLLSTGSTLLNLACTGNPMGGFLKGKYYFLVGDSQSGKTFLSLTCFAEASINSEFDDYRFIFDDVEGGAMMDIERFFGKKVVERLEPPERDQDGIGLNSERIEDFYFHVDDALSEGTPFIYVLDSMDALSSSIEGSKFEENKGLYRRGKEMKGSYGDGKAKINSSGIRQLLPGLRDTGSILIVISQTRDKIDALPFGEKKTRSGGRALRFYATAELWSSVGESLTRVVRGKKRKIGAVSVVKIKKNRAIGRERTVRIPFYYSVGIDDVGGCIDYLVGEGRWNMKGGKIEAVDFDFVGDRESLVNFIEERDFLFDLRQVVFEVWEEIESACEIKRRLRYE